MRWIAVLAALAAGGCATVGTEPSALLSSDIQAVRDCAQWYRDLDARVDAAGVRDAQDTRVAGFPYLRASRLLASYREAAAGDERVLRAMVERMQELDLRARRAEAANLPADAPGERDLFGERMVLQRASGCAAAMREADLADPAARAALLARATVPDDYSSASRVLGVYALSSIPFSEGVRRHQEEVLASYRRDLAVPPGASLVRYAPPGGSPVPRAAVAAMIAQASANPLGIPELGEAQLDALFDQHAPVFEIEVSGDHDRFGALRWEAGGRVPTVNASDLAVYRQLAWTRYRGRVLPQLVYTIWFPERPPESANDILAEELDGLVWRVTLAPDGEPGSSAPRGPSPGPPVCRQSSSPPSFTSYVWASASPWSMASTPRVRRGSSPCAAPWPPLWSSPCPSPAAPRCGCGISPRSSPNSSPPRPRPSAGPCAPRATSSSPWPYAG